MLAIADGAGSAKASDVGSKEAIHFLLQTIANSGKILTEIDELIARDWVAKTRERLAALAIERGLSPRDLACTLLFGILGDSLAVFAQIGDGGWVAQTGTGYRPITWPSRRGEYANETTFISSPDWQEDMQFTVVRERLSEVAGFSDGLQNLALHNASKSVHAPFFDTKFKALRLSGDEADLKARLIEYLSSSAVAERTDDDKTLVLACRSDVDFPTSQEKCEIPCDQIAIVAPQDSGPTTAS